MFRKKYVQLTLFFNLMVMFGNVDTLIPPSLEKLEPPPPGVDKPKLIIPDVDKPKPTEPDIDKPKPPEPGVDKPKPPEPDFDKPKPPESDFDKPKPPEPDFDKSKPPEPGVDKPKSPEPGVDKPKPPEPDFDKPKPPEPDFDKPKPPEPGVDKPKSPKPDVDKPKPPEPGVDEPKPIISDTDEGLNLGSPPETIGDGNTTCLLYTCSKSCGIGIKRSETHCSCLENCIDFGNCCYDYLKQCLEIPEKNVTSYLELVLKQDIDKTALLLRQYGKCIRYSGVGFTNVIASCPNKTDNDKKQRCDMNINKLTPLSHKSNEILNFANIYCALCHGYKENSLKPWKFEYNCPKSTKVELSDITISCNKTYLNSNLKITELVCYPHELKYSHEYVPDFGLCQTFIRPVRFHKFIAKNVHCAQLLGNNISELISFECKGDASHNELAGSPIRVLFDLDTGTAGKKGQSIYRVCPNDQIYDPFYDVCRDYICPPFQYAMNGRCYKNQTIFIDADTQPFPYLNQTIRAEFKYYYTLLNKVYLPKSGIKILNQSISEDDHNMPFGCQLTLDNTQSNINMAQMIIEIEIDNSISSIDYVNIFITTVIKDPCLSGAIMYNFDESQMSSSCVHGNATTYNNIPFRKIDSVEYALVEKFDQEFWYILNSVAFKFTVKQMVDKKRLDEIRVCEDVNNLNNLSCPMIIFEAHEFTTDGDRIKIKKGGKEIPSDQFRIIGDRAFVCEFYLTLKLKFFQLSEGQTLTSTIVTCISMLCLVMTICVYARIEQMRTLAGKMTMCLSIFLLLGQVILMINVDNKHVCYILAIANHFTWLSVFLWMSGIAINMAWTFKKTNLVGFHESQNRFKVYMIYTLIIPIIIVAVDIGLEFSSIEGSWKAGYGQDVCNWLSGSMGIIVSFYVPVALSLLTNIICFLITLRGIEKSLKAASLATKESTRSDRRRCVIYVKLSSIMGFTWIFGFVAAAVRHDSLWYIFILLNGLQGFFIFLAFVCNRRTWKMIKMSCCSKRSDRYTQSSNDTSKTLSTVT